MMKRNEGQRPFIEKVATDSRDYMQSLLDENQRLNRQIASLKDRLAVIEEESRDFSARYVEVEQQNTNLANLYVASYQLHGTLDRARVLAAIKEIVINLIGSEELAIFEVDHHFDAMMLIDSFGIDQDRWAAVPLNSSDSISLAGTTGERFISDGVKAPLAAIPLKLDEQVIGVIAIFSLLQQKTGLEALDFELFDLLASHGATALHCTRLVSEGAAQ
jgi:hypothetical protein